MKTFHHTLSYSTGGGLEFRDVSDEILKLVEKSGIRNGLVNIQTLHTTAGLLLNENEPLLLNDLKKHLEKIASEADVYEHDDFNVRTVNMCDGECANGHAHLKASHLAATATLNLIDGKLQLGQWQRILFVELDRARERDLQVLILGE